MKTDWTDIASEAYQAFILAATGKYAPPFGALPAPIQDGWRVAAAWVFAVGYHDGHTDGAAGVAPVYPYPPRPAGALESGQGAGK